MDDWSSIDDIITEFGLNGSKSDLTALRHELTLKRNELHPDKTNGSFPSEEQKAQYLKLNQAIEYVDKQSSKELALIPVSQVPAIVEAISKALSVQQPARQIAQTETAIRETHSRQVSISLKFPRLSALTLGAICGGIFTFWDMIKDNPVLGDLILSQTARSLWGTLFFVSAVFFVWTWIYEQMTQGRVEFLLSEDGLNYSMSKLIHRHSRRITKNGLEFTKRELISVLENKGISALYVQQNAPSGRTPRSKLIRYTYIWQSIASYLVYALLGQMLPVKMATECADVILTKLKERGVIQKLDRVDIEEWYQLSITVIRKIAEVNP